jgi:hypothetical protein
VPNWLLPRALRPPRWDANKFTYTPQPDARQEAPHESGPTRITVAAWCTAGAVGGYVGSLPTKCVGPLLTGCTGHLLTRCADNLPTERVMYPVPARLQLISVHAFRSVFLIPGH